MALVATSLRMFAKPTAGLSKPKGPGPKTINTINESDSAEPASPSSPLQRFRRVSGSIMALPTKLKNSFKRRSSQSIATLHEEVEEEVAPQERRVVETLPWTMA